MHAMRTVKVCVRVWAGLLDSPHALPDWSASLLAAQPEEAAHGRGHAGGPRLGHL